MRRGRPPRWTSASSTRVWTRTPARWAAGRPAACARAPWRSGWWSMRGSFQRGRESWTTSCGGAWACGNSSGSVRPPWPSFPTGTSTSTSRCRALPGASPPPLALLARQGFPPGAASWKPCPATRSSGSWRSPKPPLRCPLGRRRVPTPPSPNLQREVVAAGSGTPRRTTAATRGPTRIRAGGGTVQGRWAAAAETRGAESGPRLSRTSCRACAGSSRAPWGSKTSGARWRAWRPPSS